MPKKITLNCSGPLSQYEHRNYQSLWEDVYIVFKAKPGRRKYYLGPCLVSKTDLDRNIEYTSSTKIKNELKEIRNRLQNERFVIIELDNKNIPDIYTSAPWITRSEAEAMLDFLLNQRFGIIKPKYKWLRHKSFIIPT